MKVYLICTSCSRSIEHDIHAIVDFAEVRCALCNRVVLKRKYADDQGQRIVKVGIQGQPSRAHQ